MNEYNPYIYRCKVDRIIDGDTLDVIISLGFNLTKKTRIRLLGLDTHETYGTSRESEEYKKGIKEREYVENWTKVDTNKEFPFLIRTKKKGKYGRYLGELIYNDKILNKDLKNEFKGIEYD